MNTAGCKMDTTTEMNDCLQSNANAFYSHKYLILHCVADGWDFWVLALGAVRICEVVQTPSTKLLEQMSGVWN